MAKFTIEQDYLGEFFDPVNYDLEVGGDHPSHHFYAELAKQIDGRVLEVACGTGLVTIPLAQQGIREGLGLNIAFPPLSTDAHRERPGLTDG